MRLIGSPGGGSYKPGKCRLALLGIADPRGRIGLGFAEGASKSASNARDAGAKRQIGCRGR